MLKTSNIGNFSSFWSLKKFRKCQFSVRDGYLLRKNGEMAFEDVLIISCLQSLKNVFFRKSPFLFRQSFHLRKNILY